MGYIKIPERSVLASASGSPPYIRYGHQGGGGFNVLSLSPYAWYKNVLTDLSLAGADVITWADRSESEEDVSQATELLRPRWGVDGAHFGGNPVVICEASEFLQSAAFAIPQPAEWHFVCRQRTVQVGDAICGEGTTALAMVIGFFSNIPEANSGAAIGADFAPVGTNPIIVTWLFDGASSAIYVNDPETPEDTGNAGANAGTGVTLGARYDGTLPCDISIAEVVVTPALTDEERADLYAYFTTEHGL